MSKFQQYLLEAEQIETVEWSAPVYHGTSVVNAIKILNSRKFLTKETGGVNEIGRGVYTHPSINRTSPWVHLSSKGKAGANLKLAFKRPVKLAVWKRGLNQRELLDAGFEGLYDKKGYTQVPHQILLFDVKPIGSNLPDLSSDIIDWDNSNIIPYDADKHDYLSASPEDEKKYYYGDNS